MPGNGWGVRLMARSRGGSRWYDFCVSLHDDLESAVLALNLWNAAHVTANTSVGWLELA